MLSQTPDGILIYIHSVSKDVHGTCHKHTRVDEEEGLRAISKVCKILHRLDLSQKGQIMKRGCMQCSMFVKRCRRGQSWE